MSEELLALLHKNAYSFDSLRCLSFHENKSSEKEILMVGRGTRWDIRGDACELYACLAVGHRGDDKGYAGSSDITLALAWRHLSINFCLVAVRG